MHTAQLLTVLVLVAAQASSALAEQWRSVGSIYDPEVDSSFRAFTDSETATEEQVRFNYAFGREGTLEERTLDKRAEPAESQWYNCSYFDDSMVAGCNMRNAATNFYNVLGPEKTRSALNRLMEDAFTKDRGLKPPKSSCAVAHKTSDILCVSWADVQDMDLTEERRNHIVDFAMSCHGHVDNMFMSSQYYTMFGPEENIPGTICISTNAKACTRDYWGCIPLTQADEKETAAERKAAKAA